MYICIHKFSKRFQSGDFLGGEKMVMAFPKNSCFDKLGLYKTLDIFFFVLKRISRPAVFEVNKICCSYFPRVRLPSVNYDFRLRSTL